MYFLHRILATVVLSAAIVVLLHRPAMADFTQAYASVVCKGDRALIRFTLAWNNDQPEFTRPNSPSTQPGGWALMASKPLDRELDQLVPNDPSQCILQDGRKVLLKQDNLGDAAAYGQCGGDTTGIFSLWVGGKKVYSREKWHPKCGFPSEITEILLNDERLTECRATHDDVFADAQPATCADQSGRLSRHPYDSADGGKVVLVRSVPSREDFCRSLIRPWVPMTTNWPTYRHDGLERVEYPELGKFDDIDLDNAGKTSRVAFWEGWWGGPNGDESIWAVLPDSQNLGDDAVQIVQKELEYAGEEKVNALRESGIIVFAGDQTLYHSVYGVHLAPFVRDGTTWMHASTVGHDRSDTDPTDLILRPTPNGELAETCVFRANPAL